jgi:hypothetical protein
MAFVTILLQQRPSTSDSGTQLSLFGDEPDTAHVDDDGFEVDGLAPVRGVVVSLSLAFVFWVTLFVGAWAIMR